MPIVPPAPGRFSTTIAVPVASLKPSAMTRPMKSDRPPAENGTTIFTGCAGNGSAHAAPAAMLAARIRECTARFRIFLNKAFIFSNLR